MRVAALVALVLVLGVALRGQLPGAQPANREQPADNTAGLLGMLALVIACLLVIIVSIVASLRDPQRARARLRATTSRAVAAPGVRRSWRFLLVDPRRDPGLAAGRRAAGPTAPAAASGRPAVAADRHCTARRRTARPRCRPAPTVARAGRH